jgi:hypothetical protein
MNLSSASRIFRSVGQHTVPGILLRRGLGYGKLLSWLLQQGVPLRNSRRGKAPCARLPWHLDGSVMNPCEKRGRSKHGNGGERAPVLEGPLIVDRKTAHIAAPATLLLPSPRAEQMEPWPCPCCHSSKSRTVPRRFERLASHGR